MAARPRKAEKKDLLWDSLARVRRRVFAQRALSIASLDLLIALVAFATYLLTVRLLGLPEHPRLALAAALSAAVLATALRFALRARVSPFQAAVLADERMGLKERVSSAVHVERNPTSLPAEEWGRLIRRDGERSLAGVDIVRSFPVRLPPLARWILLPAALAAIIAFLPPLDLLGLRQSRKVDAALKREVERKRDELASALEVLRKEAEKPPDPAVEKALEALLKRPQEAPLAKEEPPRAPGEEVKREAMVEFARLEEVLKKELDRTQFGQLKEFLDRFPPGSKGSLTRGLREALKTGEFGKALSELQKLKDELSALSKKPKGDLSKEDLEKLKKLSEEMSRLARDSALLSKLSSGLSGAGGALSAGDIARALKQLEGLDGDLQSLQKMLEDMKFLESALDLAQLSLDELGKLHKCPNCGKVSQNPGGT